VLAVVTRWFSAARAQQRALTAITLKEPGRTLYLQDEQRRIVSTNAEFVPIIYAISTIAGD
jgi:hypothetical protein